MLPIISMLMFSQEKSRLVLILVQNFLVVKSHSKGLWLNFDTPAQCNGTAVEWRFCYYVDYSNNDQEMWLRIYRKSGSESYAKEAEDIISRQYTSAADLGKYGALCDGGNPPYCCESFRVNHPIEKNDVIGVCMRETGNFDPLFSVDSNATGYSVYRYVNTNDCDGRGSESFTLSPTAQIQMSDFGLHAHLDTTGKGNVEQLSINYHQKRGGAKY